LQSNVIETLYQELDLYIPKAHYDIKSQGILYCDEREVDRFSLGYIFMLQLKSQLTLTDTGGRRLLAPVDIASINKNTCRDGTALFITILS
jgi:hypothetical protein